jgi:hypothetical protein
MFNGSETHCDACSVLLGVCVRCGELIKSGDEHISQVEEWVRRAIEYHRTDIVKRAKVVASLQNGDTWSPEREKLMDALSECSIRGLERYPDLVKKLYTNKSREEMILLLRRMPVEQEDK